MIIKTAFKIALAIAGITQAEFLRKYEMSQCNLWNILAGKIKDTRNAQRVKEFISLQKAQIVELLKARKGAIKDKMSRSKLFNVVLAFVNLSKTKFAEKYGVYPNELHNVLHSDACAHGALAEKIDDFIERECEEIEKQIASGGL